MLTSQYAGEDKWEAEIKKQEQLLHTHVWKGQSNFSLEHFISQHRNAYVSMSACAEHIQYQLPNEHSQVGFLLDAIQCANAGLQAAMASVKTDNGPNGLRNNFERAVSDLLPYDPVAKKCATGIKRGSALISLAEVDNRPTTTTAANDSKPSIGKTGVHLRYHKHHEYKKLTHEQCRELSEWRQNNPDAHKPAAAKKPHAPSRPNKSKQISMLVSQQVAAEIRKYTTSAHDRTNTVDTTADDDQHLKSIVQSAVAKHFKIRKPTRPMNIPPANWSSPPANWGECVNKPT